MYNNSNQQQSYYLISVFRHGGHEVGNLLRNWDLVLVSVYLYAKCRWHISNTAELKLLPFSENGRPPYWHSISGLDFDDRWRSYNVISIFSRWPPAAILDLIWVILDYIRSAIAGQLGPHIFPEFWGNISPKWLFRTNLARKHVVWAIKRENRSCGSNGAVKKRHAYLGRSPIVPIETTICLVGYLDDVITCAKFQDKIFRGYNVTGGRISHFHIDLCMGFKTLFHCFWLIWPLAIIAVFRPFANRYNFWTDILHHKLHCSLGICLSTQRRSMPTCFRYSSIQGSDKTTSCFRIRDGSHIGILFPVSILTCISSSACHFAFACQIS